MKLIILDRDGVINWDSKNFIKSPDEWKAIPGSLEAIAAFNKAGFTIVIASNQSGIGRHYFDEKTLDAIHQKMKHELARCGGVIDRIYVCPHVPEDNCSCRKPKTGLFERIAVDYQGSLEEAWCVGDSLRDIQAGLAMHCRCVLVLTGKAKPTEEELRFYQEHQIPMLKDLAALKVKIF
jgi:D-glycero-D-manno-heptose 1,7-bisphosphate phosphatase